MQRRTVYFDRVKTLAGFSLNQVAQILDPNEKGGGPGLPASSASPCGECPADLTEGGQPVVCWPVY